MASSRQKGPFTCSMLPPAQCLIDFYLPHSWASHSYTHVLRCKLYNNRHLSCPQIQRQRATVSTAESPHIPVGTKQSWCLNHWPRLEPRTFRSVHTQSQRPPLCYSLHRVMAEKLSQSPWRAVGRAETLATDKLNPFCSAI